MSHDQIQRISRLIGRCADRFRNAGDNDNARAAGRAARAIALAGDLEIAEAIRAVLMRRWLMLRPIEGGASGPGYADSGGFVVPQPPDISTAPQPPDISTAPQPPDINTAPQPPDITTAPQPPSTDQQRTAEDHGATPPAGGGDTPAAQPVIISPSPEIITRPLQPDTERQIQIGTDVPIQSDESIATFNPETLSSTATDLAVDHQDDYDRLPDGGTQCSKFASDFAARIVGQPVSELQDKQVAAQVDALSASSNWETIAYDPGHPQAAFTRAQALANGGGLVLVAWKNPDPTPGDTGHIAVVVQSTPTRDSPDGLTQSSAWGARVPAIAQAGATVTDRTTLNWGFAAEDTRAGLKFFVLKRQQ